MGSLWLPRLWRFRAIDVGGNWRDEAVLRNRLAAFDESADRQGKRSTRV